LSSGTLSAFENGDLLDDVEIFKKCYWDTALAEIKYRPERKIESVEAVLKDTIAAAMLIAKKTSIPKQTIKKNLPF
jgi:hypothetical protein